MESTESLKQKFQKRELSTAPKAARPAPVPLSHEGRFAIVRKKGLTGDAAELEANVTEEAIFGPEGVVGLGG